MGFGEQVGLFAGAFVVDLGASPAFPLDACSAVLVSAALPGRHGQSAVGGRWSGVVRGEGFFRRGVGRWAKRWEQLAAGGFGGVTVPGRRGENDRAVGELLFGPAAGSAVERFDRVMSPTSLKTL